MAALTHGDAGEALSISGTSAASVKTYAGTVVLTATTACFVRCGQVPVAVVNVDQYLMANTAYEFSMQPGKVAAITSGGTGTLYITGA